MIDLKKQIKTFKIPENLNPMGSQKEVDLVLFFFGLPLQELVEDNVSYSIFLWHNSSVFLATNPSMGKLKVCEARDVFTH